MNGSIAIGSRRTTPTLPVGGRGRLRGQVAPMNTPCCQSRASVTSGTVVLRRPPNRIASSRHAVRVVVLRRQDRALRDRGAVPGVRVRGFGVRLARSSRCPSSRSGGRARPPGPPTTRRRRRCSATLVKTELPAAMVRMALGLDFQSVPGATPKKPNSGLTAYSRPSLPNRIQAMSSPRVSARPARDGGLQHRQVGLAAGGREGRGEVVRPCSPARSA